MPPTAVASRLFVVGCPRSGTTLLQSFLAAHPDVHSFPETHFFYRLEAVGDRRRQGLISPELSADLPQVARFLGRPELAWPEPATVQATADAFVAAADAVTVAAGATTWVEKTPANLYAIDLIERLVPGARFLHIVRDGADVAASLCSVAAGWGSSYTPEEAVELWAESVEITAAHQGRPGHAVLSYAALAEDPDRTLAAACAVLGLPFTPAMVTGRAAAARGLIKDFEAWKGDNTGPLQHRPRARFTEVFDAATQRRVEARVAEVVVPELLRG
ncbi:sulfotransferase [Modestobacter sp. VKM Ac-2983]|uniref:sulfotransferase family protein n=1 Tax=Modestobacter sp. VKM Ac-2983 TaxID=3004137 RepID=UPI0022AB83F0|nr:sulfotransferase [Modestobacter sp. VKM Ac-2983]MCZ2804053.1 sulfotransferase [Modestobacter sp. VKM Ac-2983]